MLRRRGRRKRCGRRVGAIFLQLLLLVSVSTAAYAMIVFSLSFQDFAESNREFPLPPRNRSNAPASLAYRHAVVESIRGPNFFDDPRVNPAIVILCYNRADYLQSVLDRLEQVPRRVKFTVYVSQDGWDGDVGEVVARYSTWVTHIRHTRPSLQDEASTVLLARHYRWALDHVFLERNHSHAVVLEDDLLLSDDALILFEQTAPLLDVDPSVWCVSSWNDLGFDAFALDSKALFRTDFFPGLGWMLKRLLWLEIGPVFPDDHWDHWMRLDTVSKHRSCIIPRISRNKNIGSTGATVASEYFQRHLARVKFNIDVVGDFGDLRYLHQHHYDSTLRDQIAQAQVVHGPLSSVLTGSGSSSRGGEYFVHYYVLEEYEVEIYSQLNTLPTPRTLYKGVTVLQVAPHRYLFLIDRRTSPFCQNEFRITRNPSLVVTGADQAVSCRDACASTSNGTLTCARDHFQYINQCSALRTHFPCEKGCLGGVDGDDVPNYVADGDKPELWGYCLTSEQWPTCEAVHWTSRRLCPCLPIHVLP